MGTEGGLGGYGYGYGYRGWVKWVLGSRNKEIKMQVIWLLTSSYSIHGVAYKFLSTTICLYIVNTKREGLESGWPIQA